jgi:RNA polymerase sigma-70 factor (ECF subfamily)
MFTSEHHHEAEDEDETEELIRRAGRGDDQARQRLLSLHRDRLRRMVDSRLDPRLAARLDPSDVVQEALMDAAGRLEDYLRDRPLPFYAWLRQFAWERVIKLHERHVTARKRTVCRERALDLPDRSGLLLAGRLAASTTSPGRRLSKEEQRERVRAALAHLPPRDREILALLYLEGLNNKEAAAVLGIGEGAVKMRHLRALGRLRDLMGSDSSEVAR